VIYGSAKPSFEVVKFPYFSENFQIYFQISDKFISEISIFPAIIDEISRSEGPPGYMAVVLG